MTLARPGRGSARWSIGGVRGRVVLTVVVVTACLYSLLGTVGFLYIANGGRDDIGQRVDAVLDQLEAALRNGSAAVSILTPDGVEAFAVDPAGPIPSTGDDVIIRQRDITIGSRSLILVGRASQARLTDSLRSLHRGLWIGVPLAVLLTAAMTGLATRRALRPVSEITALAATIGASDVSTRVPVPDTGDEIEHLASTVNEMLDRIAAGRAAQQQFTSDAAHELRTPLMALQGEIELAARGFDATGEEFLDRLTVGTDRLARRVEDLMLLSTIDERPPLDLRLASVLDVVHAEVATMRRGDPQPTITITGPSAMVVMDEHLVSRAVRNLLANAFRHARRAVHVEVVDDGAGAWVHIDDDGTGVAPADRPTIFRRFARLDESRHQDAGGAGLGLAIVASVAHAHGGDVAVADADLGGARVSIWLPARGGCDEPAT